MIFGLSYLDITIIALYMLLIVYLGFKTKNKVNSTGDYFMAGRKGSRFMMIANGFGGATHTDQAIGVAGATYEIGLGGIWYQWMYLFVTPFFWLLGPVYRRCRYVTTSDFFEERYGTKHGISYSVMALLYFLMDIGLILKGTGTAIEAVTHGAISSAFVIIFVTIFFLAYSVIGGLRSALVINLVQGLFILIFSFLLIPFAISAGGGITAIKAQLPAHMFSFVAPKEATLFFIIMVVINGLIGIVVQPHHMALGGAGKSEKSCRTGWTYGTFTKRFATLGWAFVGVLAAALYPGLTNSNRENAFGMMVANLLPSGLLGLMVAAMIAAILAVLHNYMVGGSAIITRNFYKKIYTKDLTAGKELKIARMSSVLLILGGVSIALVIPSVIQGLVIVWHFTAFFGIGFWMALMWRRANRYGLWATLIVTILATLYSGSYFSFGLGWSTAYQIALYLPLGFLTMIIVSSLTKSEPEENLNRFYALLHTPVGEEYKLRNNGMTMIFEGESIHASSDKNESLEENGHSLLLVDLLSLHKKFSFKKYRVDIVGFLWASLFVLGIFAFALFVAGIG
ncbi:MAG: sodium:solute symporter family protein [Ignavibacteriales bacterium]|nr:sodium:solute symporter family protein [Ignavibacteriales bacterium]